MQGASRLTGSTQGDVAPPHELGTLNMLWNSLRHQNVNPHSTVHTTMVFQRFNDFCDSTVGYVVKLVVFLWIYDFMVVVAPSVVFAVALSVVPPAVPPRVLGL